MKWSETLDPWSMTVIILTLVLFIAALFVKGLTHALLLEAGVFLVSVKLIMMSYKIALNEKKILSKLDEIQQTLQSGK